MKKLNIKNIILFAILILALIFAAVFFAFQKSFNDNVKKDFNVVDSSGGKVVLSDDAKDRLNILILGLESTRTDMIMVATFDPKSKTLNMISIPRDTYVENNYKDGSLKKINSVYEMPSTTGGAERVASEVSKILGIPIHDYVMIDYNAVGEITDAVGGIEVNIPFNMYYDDPYSKPPLHIYFKKGINYLDGSNAIKYLRWRQNNDGSYGQEGDEGRIKRQQIFIKKLLEKALNPTTLPKTIEVAFNNVETSLELSQVMGLVADAVSMPKENIKFYQEIGVPSYFNGLWYYLADKDSTQALMQKIINNSTITDDDLNPSKSFESAALARGNDSTYIKSTSTYEEDEQSAPITSVKTVDDTQPTDDIIFANEGEETSSQSSETQSTQNQTTDSQEQTSEDINNSVVDNSSQTTDSTTTNNQQSGEQPAVQPPAEQTPPENSGGEEAPIF